MGVAEIVYLCVIVAVVSGCLTWALVNLIGDYKCIHKYEEIINTIDSNGKGTVVHMCKKCGKRKITKVK